MLETHVSPPDVDSQVESHFDLLSLILFISLTAYSIYENNPYTTRIKSMTPITFKTKTEEAPSCSATKNWHITEVNPHNNLNNSFITTIFKVQVQIYELFSIKTSV